MALEQRAEAGGVARLRGADQGGVAERSHRLAHVRIFLCERIACQTPRTPMSRSIRRGVKYSGAGRLPVSTDRKRSISGWLPSSARTSISCSGRGGAKDARSVVISYIGRAAASRAAW